jgi:hypothetical protein
MVGDHRFTMILSIINYVTPLYDHAGGGTGFVMMIDCLDSVLGIRQAHRYEEPVRVRDGSCGAGRTRLSP